MGETPYVETELLLAFLNEDDEAAIRLAEEMSQGERDSLLGHLVQMRDLLSAKSWCLGCGRYLDPSPQGEPWTDRWHDECHSW
jgi:hypothetical protein